MSRCRWLTAALLSRRDPHFALPLHRELRVQPRHLHARLDQGGLAAALRLCARSLSPPSLASVLLTTGAGECADEEDPHEFVNLATQPQYAALMKELFTELQEMLEEAR